MERTILVTSADDKNDEKRIYLVVFSPAHGLKELKFFVVHALWRVVTMSFS